MPGEVWAVRARSAAVSLTSRQDTPESLGIELLRDIRTVWPIGEPTVAAAELVKLLRAVEEMRWAEHRGNGLTARSLLQFLRQFGIHCHNRESANVYAHADLADDALSGSNLRIVYHSISWQPRSRSKLDRATLRKQFRRL
jgi:hypothetical protein